MQSPFLPDWPFAHAERDPSAPAVDSPTTRLTYGELADRVRTFAGHLAAGGVSAGDSVVVSLPNSPAAVVAGLAIHLLGATVVEVNREWGANVLAGIVAQTRARQAVTWGRDVLAWGEVAAQLPLDRVWIVHPGALQQPVRRSPGNVPTFLLLEDGRADPALGPPPAFARPILTLDQPALILYTSGSTGRPRGVIQTFRNLEANTRSIVKYLGLSSQDRALLVLPLYYCYGRSVLQTHLFAGGSIFLDGRFAFPRTVVETLASEGCTGFAGVPLTFEILRRQVDVSTIPFRKLRYLTQAGGAMAPDTIDWVRAAFRPADLYVMYGQTEATARLSYLPPERAQEKRGSIGIPIPGVELAVVDERARLLPPGETGFLVARGDNVTVGYLDDPEETSSILHDGWLWTGTWPTETLTASTSTVANRRRSSRLAATV